ncbi:Lsr2 protein [Quadrisphaera granulorum]|uniref:Lsr2 protein n=1 Tax=Quadrisphaera granulorum TaxID=317664 RepID=A0A316AD83_9ACTN|nr:Lsr2 family protein [Quadrisphaera granulorum]PWJ54844.1 Lsr2 protein [Quadrisphaera granulorum]SZE95790.1 Lsr2 protein [Quadrisphaera granulorum]
MATKTITHITDDLDGVSDAETVKFGLWGATYEIDLSDENQKKLEAALEPFLAVARKSTAPAAARRTSAARSTSSDYDAKAVRAWAASNGVTVPARGRIPGKVLEQYQAAH